MTPVRALYIKRVLSAIKTSKVDSLLLSLQAQVKIFLQAPPSERIPLLAPLVTAYDTLHSTLDAIRSDVESKLRPLYNGAIPWSPRLQKYLDII